MMMTITTTIMIMMTDIVKELLRYLGLWKDTQLATF